MDLERENELLKQEIKELRQALNAALKEIKELKAQLGQNSQNSSWPPSRDKTRKPKRKKSLRQPSGKRRGAQPGHPGKTLEFHSAPDRVIEHRPTCCEGCGSQLDESLQPTKVIRRQVFDIPEPKIEVTEHQAFQISCPNCKQVTKGRFPLNILGPVQYGKRLKQLAVYLKQYQLMPYDRSAQLIADLFGHKIGQGSLQNFTKMVAERLKPTYENIKEQLIHSPVAHFDESGCYINGERYWVHVASTKQLTIYMPHQRRGKKGTDAMGILGQFKGSAVHDLWSAYMQYDHCQHGLCHVHHLRDLNGLFEHTQQNWIRRFQAFLIATKRCVERSKEKQLTSLTPPKLAQVNRIYDKLTQNALESNLEPPGGWPRRKRGRPKKTKSRNFAERLRKYRKEMLLFAHDFDVPFDNNLAERDIRMLKVQQKISGCFRSWDGATDFCVTRSYISTMIKQGVNAWDSIGSVVDENFLAPQTLPV